MNLKDLPKILLIDDNRIGGHRIFHSMKQAEDPLFHEILMELFGTKNQYGLYQYQAEKHFSLFQDAGFRDNHDSTCLHSLLTLQSGCPHQH